MTQHNPKNFLPKFSTNLRSKTKLMLSILLLICLICGVSVEAASRLPRFISQVISSPCSDQSPIDTSKQKDRNLKKLGLYQDICNSKVASDLMIFTVTPTSVEGALNQSVYLYQQIKAFAIAGVRPLIIMEPSDEESELLSFRNILAGEYDSFVRTLFGNLKKLGLTADELGTVVLFPEANTPLWNFDGTIPADFSRLFNQHAAAIKSQIPEANLSIMLNSFSYDPSDTEWDNPLPMSFLDYVRDIKPEYISSVGIQGFGWISRRSNQNQHQLLNPQD
jgi:hypothetical protein